MLDDFKTTSQPFPHHAKRNRFIVTMLKTIIALFFAIQVVVARDLQCMDSKVTGFQLVDTESPYRPVVTSFTPPYIDLLDFPTCALNIYALVKDGSCGAPACVKLTLADQVRKEVEAPYALYGNTGRFIRSGKPALGAQTLTACAYTDAKCTVGMHGCLSVDVMIKDCIAMSMSM